MLAWKCQRIRGWGSWRGRLEGLEISEAPSKGNWAFRYLQGPPQHHPGHLGASWPHAYLLEQTEGVLMPKCVVGLPDGWGINESHSVMSDSLWPHRLHSPWNSPGQDTGVGSLSLLQGIEPRSPALWADSLPAEPQGKGFGVRGW